MKLTNLIIVFVCIIIASMKAQGNGIIFRTLSNCCK
ncbi:hypothetical protein CVS40_12309 [Lucilia cuprina]|nr:hypothetical protein CVS40_12309 [Lucilia cuprina]